MQSFMDTMEATGADFTNSFRCLSGITLPGTEGYKESLEATKAYLLQQCSSLDEMIKICRPKMDMR